MMLYNIVVEAIPFALKAIAFIIKSNPFTCQLRS